MIIPLIITITTITMIKIKMVILATISSHSNDCHNHLVSEIKITMMMNRISVITFLGTKIAIIITPIITKKLIIIQMMTMLVVTVVITVSNTTTSHLLTIHIPSKIPVYFLINMNIS